MMRLFLAGLMVLMLTFVVHVITWRFHRPRLAAPVAGENSIGIRLAWRSF